MTQPTRKILMFHGYSQNAKIFNKRTAAIRKSLPKNVDLVYIDGPHLLPIPSEAGTAQALGAASAEAAEEDPTLKPRAWWKVDDARTTLRGLEETLVALRDVLAKDRYEGVFGFSQGAAMAALLSALLERPEAYPAFSLDGKAPHPPFKFCVAVSGFNPNFDPLAQRIMGSSFSTPTLHVIGRTDVIVSNERSQTLVDVSASKRVEWHDGGHFVPSKMSWRKFWQSFLSAEDPFSIPSPVGTDSGTSTPTSVPVVQRL